MSQHKLYKYSPFTARERNHLSHKIHMVLTATTGVWPEYLYRWA